MRPRTGMEGCATWRAGTCSRARLHGRGRDVPGRLRAGTVLGLHGDRDKPGAICSPLGYYEHCCGERRLRSGPILSLGDNRCSDGDGSITPMHLGARVLLVIVQEKPFIKNQNSLFIK